MPQPKAAPGQPGPGDTETETPPKPLTPAEKVLAQRTELRAKITEIRDRADKSAKVIGAIATALAGYLAIAKLSDIFPFYADDELDKWALRAVILAAAALVLGVLSWISVLGRVGLPVGLTTAEPIARSGPDKFSPGEVELVKAIYKTHAELNDMRTLADLETNIKAWRRARLECGAEPSTVDGEVPTLKDKKWRPASDLEVLENEIRVLFVRASLEVVRFRYAKAFAGVRAGASIVVAAAGYVALAISSNYLVGESAGQLARAKECATLVESQWKAGLRPTAEIASCHDLAPGIAEKAKAEAEAKKEAEAKAKAKERAAAKKKAAATKKAAARKKAQAEARAG